MFFLRTFRLLSLTAFASGCGSTPAPSPEPAGAVPVALPVPAALDHDAGTAPTAEKTEAAHVAVPAAAPPPETGPAFEQDPWRAVYLRGREHERQRRFLEAIAAYTELVDQRGGYDDADLRRKTLIALVGLAEELYARGVATNDDEEALALFEEIEVFWPAFRDLPVRLEALRGG